MKKYLPMRAFLVLFSVLLVALSNPALARTAYVDDVLEITLRTGDSTKNSIITMLPSGTSMDVISSDDDSGYSKVLTADGKEGFVLTRFITYQPIARDRLEVANRRLEQRNTKVANLEAELRDLRNQNTEYSSSQSNLQSNNARLADELGEIKRTAANALMIADENRTLKTRQSSLETQIQDLQQRNKVLNARSSQTWYLAGAGTLIAGILAGLILPRIKFKKRSRWGEL